MRDLLDTIYKPLGALWSESNISNVINNPAVDKSELSLICEHYHNISVNLKIIPRG